MEKRIIEQEKLCSWCKEPIKPDQLQSTAFDGERMHFGCAAQCDDDEPYISD